MIHIVSAPTINYDAVATEQPTKEKPSKGLIDRTSVACTFPEGYFEVPACDYDEAFEFERVTKGDVKYALSMNYVKKFDV